MISLSLKELVQQEREKANLQVSKTEDKYEIVKIIKPDEKLIKKLNDKKDVEDNENTDLDVIPYIDEEDPHFDDYIEDIKQIKKDNPHLFNKMLNWE